MTTFSKSATAWCRGPALVLLAFGASAAMADTSPVTSLYSFTGGADGSAPGGQLLEASDGYLYGTTPFTVPQTCCGGIYKIKKDGTGFAAVYTFTGGDDGASPLSGLVQGSDGSFYGVTSGNGASGNPSNGTVFKLGTDGTLSNLHVFNYNDGYSPQGRLAIDASGNLYGTTLFGGEDGSGDGTVFKVATDGSGFATLYAFDAFAGQVPAGVILGSDGRLYGTTQNGGSSSFGSVFSLNTDGSGFTTLHSFASSGTDGREPTTSLVQAADGTLYGTTPYGGAAPCGPSGCGTIYKISPDGSGFATVYSFTGGVDGSDPLNSLTIGANGDLYSGTYSGVLYEISTGGNLVGVYSMDNYDPYVDDNFVSPSSALTLASDGKMYGVTMNGGADLVGTVFSLDPNGLLPALPPPTVTLTSSTKLVKGQQSATLTWTSSNASSCTASGDWSGSEPVSGSLAVKPSGFGRHSYTLTCSNANGVSAASTVSIAKL